MTLLPKDPREAYIARAVICELQRVFGCGKSPFK